MGALTIRLEYQALPKELTYGDNITISRRERVWALRPGPGQAPGSPAAVNRCSAELLGRYPEQVRHYSNLY